MSANTISINTATQSIALAAEPITTTKSLGPMETLLQNQMKAFVAKMTADGTLTADGQVAAMAQVTEMMSTISIPTAAPRPRGKKKTVEPELRCMARVWGDGTGTQCSYQRKSGEYCNRCHKKSLVTTEPCQYNAEGQHIGLFWGRFDEERPFMSKGAIAVQWKDSESVAQVAAALASGIKHRLADTKTKGPRKPKAANKAKGKKQRPRRVKNAFFHFLGTARAEKKAELIAAAAEGEKVGVSDVAKALGAVWKTMDTEARAPYTVLEAAGKAVALAEFEALMASLPVETALVDTIVAVTTTSLVTIEDPNNGLGNDEIGDMLDQALNDLGDDVVEEVVKEVSEVVEEATEEATEEVVEEEGEEVEECTLADGSCYYKGSDGTLYDPATQDIIGTWNEEDNTLIVSN